jgi:hypothetical protein
VPCDFYVGGPDVLKHLPHFLWCVRLAHGCGGVIASDAAAVDDTACACHGEVDRMAYQIIDQHRYPAAAQSLFDENGDLVGRKMMDEQATINKVKAGVAKGKSKSIANDLASILGHMAGAPIE